MQCMTVLLTVAVQCSKVKLHILACSVTGHHAVAEQLSEKIFVRRKIEMCHVQPIMGWGN